MQILEVSPRDGLQNEKKVVSVEDRLELINRALDAGIKQIEVASFVHPKRVPQMAGAEELIQQLPERDDVTYIGLVLNMRGAERALSTSVDELGAVSVASDTFAQKNQGQTCDQSVEVACEIIRTAKAEGRRANATISAAFGCPFEGEVPIERVVAMAERIAETGPDQIAIADTIGVGDPWCVEAILGAVSERLPNVSLRAHFHNTRNTGLANAFAAAAIGVDTLDASIGGVGGCPFAPAATGNIPTEDLVYMLERGGRRTGVDLNGLISTADWLSHLLGRELPAMVGRAGAFPGKLIAT